MNKRVILKGNLIKETNYKRILQLIGKGAQLTKLDIAYTLKISIPTVTTNINDLKQEGIIEEVESDIYTGGRRPKIIKLIPNSRVAIGMSISKYKVVVVFTNLLEESILIKEVEYEATKLEDYIIKGQEIIAQGIEELEIDEEVILGIGISIPGIINQNLNIIEQTNMGDTQISLERIYDMFEASMCVYIENEANLSLLAEKSLGKHENTKNMLYIGINEGLGGGILVKDELFTGTSGRAAEFGHMIFKKEETGAYYKVEDKLSTIGLINQYEKKTRIKMTHFTDFEKLVQEKDSIAIEILEEGIEALVMAIYNVSMVLDVQTIIIGGKVARLIQFEQEHFNRVMSRCKDMLEHLDLNLYFSDVKNTTAMGAALLPIIDFYKINNENE